MIEQMTLDQYRYRDQYRDQQDICANRSRHNANSRAANARIAPSKAKQREEVMKAIRAAGSDGLTCKELAAAWGVGMNQISGRFSELKAAGLIKPLSRRDGCGVFVLLATGEEQEY